MNSPTPSSRPFNPRTAAMLLIFAAIICGSVILADSLSPRSRGDTTTHPTTPPPSSR